MKIAPIVIFLSALLNTNMVSATEIQFNGFASFVVGQTLEQDEALYQFDDALNFKSESRFGLQAHTELAQGLSATAQLIARGSDDFEAKFEWAFVSYKASANNTFSVGRIRIPFYRQSEYLETGYAYHWLRTPGNVYNSRFNSWDGIGWVNKHKLLKGAGQLQLQVGRLEDDELKVRPGEFAQIDLAGVVAEYKLRWQNWQARVGYLSTEISVVSTLNDFFAAAVAGVEQNGVNVPELYIDNFLLEDDHLEFYSSSLFYDNARFFIGAEATQSIYQDLSINPDNNHYYLTAGLYDNEWTYHLSFGETDNKRRLHSELVSGLGLEEAQNAALASITQGFTSTAPLSGERSEFYSFGVNYQFDYSAIFKVDYTSYNHLNNPALDADLISFAIDLVF